MNSRRKNNFTAKLLDIFDIYPREYYVLAFFLVFFLVIISKVFSYTVLNYDFYKKLADKQQIGEVEIPVTRGAIYSDIFDSPDDDLSIISRSVYLSNLAIDPKITGDKEKLSTFLTDILYEEMCGYETRDSCYNNILRFTKKLEISDFQIAEDYVKRLILERVTSKVTQEKVTSVLLKSEITLEQEHEISSWNIAGVYPSIRGLYINPEELLQPDLFAKNYVKLFGGRQEDVVYSVRRRDVRYIPIYNKLSLLASDKIEKYLEEERQVISQGILEKEESIGGFIILSPHAQRVYPEKHIASQISGFLDNEGRGHYGLEGYFNDILKGNPGALVAKKDVIGRSIEFNAFENKDLEAVEGVDIFSTIDRNAQRIVEDILQKGVEKYRANKGTVVVMEPKTGRILSMANYPSFDANNPGEVYELKRVNYVQYPDPETDLLGKSVFVEDLERGDKFYYDGSPIYLREAEREEYVDYEKKKYIYRNEFGAGVYKNDAISSLYEPGSIMKAITVAVGIDTDEIRAYDFYNDEGKLTIDNFTIKNVDKKCLGYNTFQNALNFSCNVGMIRIVQRVGKALLHQYLGDFGFGDITGITLAGEIFGKLEPYEKWPISKLLTTSYGLGISATPLQMATAYSVLANGGVYMKPYIVDKITYNDGREILYKPEAIRRVIKESTSDTMIKMLVDGVQNGVAKNGAVEGYSVAGKTGTSQIAYKGKYEKGVASTNGSYAGFAPAEDPKFVIVVKLERPRTSQYGGSTSAYIFSDIARELLNYYQIPKRKK